MINRYFHLKANAELVKGKAGGTILDFTNKKVYAIDLVSMAIIDAMINGKSVEEAINVLEEEEKEKFINYLNNICNLGIGEFTPEFIKRDLVVKKVEKNIDTVWFELRKSCNLRCCHCYMDCDSKSDSDLYVMSVKEWKAIVDMLLPHKIKKIVLIGGEPLLFEGLEELIDYIRLKLNNTMLVLYSNLTILRDSHLDCIVRNNVKVVTSLYSYNEETHDEITGRKGSWYKTVQGIEMIKKSGGTVRANIVAMKTNCSEIEDTKAFIKDITGFNAKVDLVRNVGSSKSYLEIDSVRGESLNIFPGISKSEFIRNISGNSCWQGKINITCDGYISPCIMGEEFVDKTFNIRTSSLKTILDNYIIPNFWSLSRDKIEDCKECQYRYVCRDCRPLCGNKENLLKREKDCIIVKSS